jgi:HK97 family phage portal protein
MNLFGRKAAPRAARPELTRFGAGTTGWPTGEQSYEAQVREGYCRNPIAQRAVRLVAEAVSGAPLIAAPAAFATLIRTRSGAQALVETATAQLLLSGNAYVQLLTDADGHLAELFALRPERVGIEPDAQGWPAAYLYRCEGRATRLSPAAPRPQIAHVKLFNPLDDHKGLGCLGAAAPAIALHNAASAWNRALLANGARPSGALVYEPGDGSPLAPDQFDRLRAELDASFAGAANAGRPLLLEGGLKWQALSLTPADMDFVGLKAAAAREIATAFGVPPMLLGLPGDATYANYREASRALWRQTILPIADTLFAALVQAARDWFPDAELRIDLDRVPALAEDRERLWAQVSAADFLTPEEKRAAVGL